MVWVPVAAVLYLCGRQLVAVGVHGGQDVDARAVDQRLHALVAQRVLGAQVLGQVDEQLAAEHLVTVHVAHQLDLRLHWAGERRPGRKRRCHGGVGGGGEDHRGVGEMRTADTKMRTCMLDARLISGSTGKERRTGRETVRDESRDESRGESRDG